MLDQFSLPPLTWIAIVDIVIVAFVIYQGLVFIKGRRAVHVATGVALALAFFFFASRSRLDTVSWLLSAMLPFFPFLIIIVFQSEIRRALAHFGQTAFFRDFSKINRNEFTDEILLAVTALASRQTGALIVIERDIGLKTFIESGIAIDATLSYDLLVTIFKKDVSLHDGAVIIQNGRIAAAACFLPLTVKPRLSRELGTRHRAAIGITEETDAVAIVVSEETGALSFAHDGEVERWLDPETLRARLREAFERKGRLPLPPVATPARPETVDR
jgi:diadenylate cyclase